VADQFAAATADLGIQARRPRQALPAGQLVDVALSGVVGHRQARGPERARGDPGWLPAARCLGHGFIPPKRHG
jgi:hypothetical protein